MGQLTVQERRRIFLARHQTSREMLTRLSAPVAASQPFHPRHRLSQILKMAAIALSLAGCASLQADGTRATERMLAAAGFQTTPADTPEKLAHLQTLTPGKILRQERNGEPYYVYADRNGCKCLYAGTEQQYQQYRELARQRTMADEAALVTEEASDSRLWGLWPWP